ncbi:MAG: hypothetical protein AAF843_04085 [Bacteroidota bacterium]
MGKRKHISDLSATRSTPTSKAKVKKAKVDLLKEPRFLGLVVGISASESDDLQRLGLSELHLNDLIVEISRYLLASGASLAYGGDLRKNGITQTLIELVDRYRFDTQDQANRLRSYLAYPINLTLEKEEEARYIERIKFIKVTPPKDLHRVDSKQFIPPEGLENLYMRSRNLTHMREVMEKDCNARIFIAGRSTNFKGIAPGVLEELFISLKSTTPVYLIGSYGGITSQITSHLNDEAPIKDLIKSICNEQHFVEMKKKYEEKGQSDHMTWPEELPNLLEGGWGKISSLNGLSVEENKRLTKTIHNNEIIYYLLKGLTQVSTNQKLTT